MTNTSTSRLQRAAEAINILQDGDKITITGISEFGFPYVRQAKFTSMITSSYAQYDFSIVIYFVSKGKRSKSGTRILPNTEMAIYKGWIDLEDNSYTAPVEKNGMIMRESRYSCFDKRYFKDVIAQTEIKPIVLIDPDDDAVKKIVYKVVKELGKNEIYNSLEELQQNYEIMGYSTSQSVRKEMEESPKLKGLLGAMWDGLTADGKGILRYETQAIYNMMSN
ncbi:MAG TPA: hypothetical protein VIK86_07890 [Candidatus Paceibacterota bacterium]